MTPACFMGKFNIDELRELRTEVVRDPSDFRIKPDTIEALYTKAEIKRMLELSSLFQINTKGPHGPFIVEAPDMDHSFCSIEDAETKRSELLDALLKTPNDGGNARHE